MRGRMVSQGLLLAVWSILLLVGQAVELSSAGKKAQNLNYLMRSARGQHSSRRAHSHQKGEDGDDQHHPARTGHAGKHASKASHSGRRAGNDVDSMAVQANGALKMDRASSARENPQHERRKHSCLHGADSCMHRVSRLRPHKAHRTAGFKINEAQTPSSTTATSTGNETLLLPASVTCKIYVDDVLDGVYYNGSLITIAGVTYGTSTATCSSAGFTVTLTPVMFANLTIIAHDSMPGTGVSSCAGIGVSCTAGGTPYAPMNSYGYGSWTVRGQASALVQSPGEWNVVGKGTSTSTACGLAGSSGSVSGVQFWVPGSVYVAAQWGTPGTTSTTTTTTTSLVVNVTKAAAGATVPSLIALAFGQFILISRA